MNDEKNRDSGAKNNLLKAIEAFEQILEVIPDDHASLEALFNAYEQLGDRPKAVNYLVRLVNVFLEEKEFDSAKALLPKLENYRLDFEDAANLISRLQSLEKKDSHDSSKIKILDYKVSHSFNIQDALNQAWRLLDAKEISDAEYAKLVQDLTEMSVAHPTLTTSVPHVLQHSGFKGLERILNFMARDCGTPVISLSSYDIPPEISGLLPITFSVGRGVLPFAVLGSKDVLVVVMNPYDKSLAEDIKALTGMNCHRYLTLPNEFDAAISKITNLTGSAQK